MDKYIESQNISKEEANYRHHERCGTCAYFCEGLEKCELVGGRISRDTVCDHWKINKTEYYDKEFFKKQLEKV